MCVSVKGGGGEEKSPILNRTIFLVIYICRSGKRKQVHCLCIPFPLASKKILLIPAYYNSQRVYSTLMSVINCIFKISSIEKSNPWTRSGRGYSIA